MENIDNLILNGKKVCFLSLGCKVNAYETEVFREAFEKCGAVTVAFEAGNADIVVINTCSVTNIADRKSRQMLHRARKLSPNAVIVAAGCYVQAVGEDVVRSGDADVAAGNDRKSAVVELAAAALKERFKEKNVAESGNSAPKDNNMQQNAAEPVVATVHIKNAEQTVMNTSTLQKDSDTIPAVPGKPDTPENGDSSAQDKTVSSQENNISDTEILSGCHERTRAFIKVTDGCNQFCAYCIIPYVRGRVRSRSIKDVTDEVIRLRDSGYKEIVLTGIHLSSYGVDMTSGDEENSSSPGRNYEKAVAVGFNGRPLLELIDAVSWIEGIERIRLGSLEPRIITEAFIDRLRSNPRVCPHFHLSLQSGSDSVLKRMKRHYTTTEYENACRIIRNAYDAPSINTDIIVGFPGETEAEFAETLAFADRIGFAKIHIFKYSRRKGTLADKMPDQIPESVKTERSTRLQQTDADNHRRYVSGFIGKNVRILVEQEENIDGKTCMTGLTERYVKVAVSEGCPEQNTFVECEITGMSENGILIGRLNS